MSESTESSTPGDRSSLRELFEQVMKQPASERMAFVDRLCAGDAALRDDLASLVAAAGSASAAEFLGAPTQSAGAAGAATIKASSGAAAGAIIGPYKLLQLIGEGGFGEVFMAEQSQPVQRRVALKIVKLGLDTKQVIARFEAERQALAMMDHPNIAKVLDAGATDTGRPYFVMELVKGEPITSYCDRNNLSIDQRLELFAHVCNAVQHSHQKGVIHRDIKPSNILVSTQDGKPFAKVLDFGIAKATAARLTEKTLFTEHRTLIGTPEYMSPEQAEGSLDVDTRTDVYSLGVLLYELLTGATPFDSEKLRSAAYGELQRIIREVDPPNPSTRLSQNTDTIGHVAAHRRTEPRRLGSIIRGELDWIVMKALEKDRARRYETPSSLAADVLRYLAGDAIIAAPPSAAYRFSKFIKRHRSLVASAAAVALALLIGVVGFAWQAKIARQQRDLAVNAQRAADEQRDRAVKAEAQTSERARELQLVADFQADMLARVDPIRAGLQLSDDIRAQFAASLADSETLLVEADRAAQLDAFTQSWARISSADAARNLIVSTILKPAQASIEAKFKDQPVVDASLRQSLASVYRELGLYDAAMPLQTAALGTRTQLLGQDHRDTLRSMNNMGMLFDFQGDLDRAEPILRECLERSRRALGDDDEFTLTAICNLGYVLEDRGELDKAEPLYREALERRRRVLGDEADETLMSLNNLGFLLMSQSKFAEAETHFREAYETRQRVFGEDDVGTLVPLNNLGLVLQRQGRFAEAEPLFRRILEQRGRLLGEDHPQTLTSLNNVGFVLQSQGRNAEAEPFSRETLEKYQRLMGADHPNTLGAMNNLAMLMRAQGKLAEAEPYSREVTARLRVVLGEEHQNTLMSMMNLGSLLQMQGKLAEAEPLFQEALDTSRRALGEEHHVTLKAIAAMGRLRFDQARLEEAQAFDLEALEKRRRALGDTHPETLLSVIALGELRVAQGNDAEAVALLAAIEEPARGAFTAGNATSLANLLKNLGVARTRLAKDPADFAAAEASLLAAHAIYLQARGEQHKDTRSVALALADLYAAWNVAEPGQGHEANAAEWKAKLADSPGER